MDEETPAHVCAGAVYGTSPGASEVCKELLFSHLEVISACMSMMPY